MLRRLMDELIGRWKMPYLTIHQVEKARAIAPNQFCTLYLIPPFVDEDDRPIPYVNAILQWGSDVAVIKPDGTTEDLMLSWTQHPPGH